MERILVCITGASGSIYALRLLSALAVRGTLLHVTCSSWGARTLLEETGRPIGYWLGKIRANGGPGGTPALITMHASDNFSTPIASSSFKLSGTVILPCSMETIGSLASGSATNLIHQAGAIALQEGWPLIVVPRETPLSLISLRAMTALKEAGATILPACPNFSTSPSTIEDLVDSVVYRILDHLER
ncbi:MAG: UbiX family flavin prenyltransferase [Spirochaetaceae bacterium]|nr:UbiX family flavin prenyltransferase [Spirochaetaceae bacterium]